MVIYKNFNGEGRESKEASKQGKGSRWGDWIKLNKRKVSVVIKFWHINYFLY